VDVSVYYKGWHGDLNETFIVGTPADVDEESKKLVKAAHDALQAAIAICKPGARYRDLGDIITRHCRALGFSVVKTYCGHGIGDLFHCAPNVPHYHPNKAKGVMKVGEVFTIEPMVNAGSHRDRTWPDGW
jgi:methionyl aminopeptidase